MKQRMCLYADSWTLMLGMQIITVKARICNIVFAADAVFTVYVCGLTFAVALASIYKRKTD